MADAEGFTTSERRILVLLADGDRHRLAEVHETLKNGDDQMDRTAVYNTVSRVRAKLRRKGQDIICEFYQNGYYYRHVRLLLSLNSNRSE